MILESLGRVIAACKATFIMLENTIHFVAKVYRT